MLMVKMMISDDIPKQCYTHCAHRQKGSLLLQRRYGRIMTTTTNEFIAPNARNPNKQKIAEIQT
jgi:hypothetical protein